ncbi:MFS transporter [Paracoccus denitrificans]|uniref:MFS transporter n=1 Tax=Paracoccus denitrificans TaxID=266 RepID=UPI0018F7E6FA|nr:MFS transporter [Paracoccus denitrificans]UFS67178.1 MFS transporter [Paracoccus denitrificans]
MTQTAERAERRTGIAARANIIATAAAFGLTYGLSAPLIALELDAQGVSGLLIGANAAMHALGVLLIAPILPRIVGRLGFSRPARLALIAAAVLLAAFPLLPVLWLWFGLRILLGMASESLFVISEAWLSEVTEEGSRSRTMGIYVAAMSAGIALGPVILSLTGRNGALPFLIGSAFALAALLILTLGHPAEAPPEAPSRSGLAGYLLVAPLAAAAAALNAAVEAAGLALLPLYAMKLGWSEAQGTLLLSVLLIGAIMLQLPLGWLGERLDRGRLVVGLSIAAGLGALVWPAALSHPWLAWPLLFLWGGAFVGIYTQILTQISDSFRGADLAGVFAVMSVAWGIGALVGPMAGGLATHLTRHGLPWFAAAACLTFAGAALKFGITALRKA